MSPIANMLVQIRNAQAAGHPEVLVPFSALKQSIAAVLTKEGFVKSVDVKQRIVKKTELPFLAIALAVPGISGMRMISKPSRRLYAGKKTLPTAHSGLGTAIVTTSRGIMTSVEARKAGIGGEVMFEIW